MTFFKESHSSSLLCTLAGQCCDLVLYVMLIKFYRGSCVGGWFKSNAMCLVSYVLIMSLCDFTGENNDHIL